MENEQLKSQLINTIKNVIALSRGLAEISPSLFAMRKALNDVSPDRFETAYLKYFVEEDCKLIQRGISQVTESLLESVQQLQQS